MFGFVYQQQDSWKATPDLTVNYGLRLDYSHNPSPVPANTFVSPRIGIALTPKAGAKTVVRAGAGLFVAPTVFMIPFYSNLLGDSGKYINQNALVAPFPSIFAAWAIQSAGATPAFPNPPLTDAQLAAAGATISPPGPAAFGNIIYTIGPHFKPEYTIQASASVAREFAGNLTIELGYLLYRSVHIEQVVETNFVRSASTPVDPFAGPAYVPASGFTAGEPDSAIFQNNAYSSVGSGIYSGATASVTRRVRKGLQFQANYTFSRAIDDTSDFSSLSTPFRPDLLNLDRAISDFNVTHNFVANAVYALPFHKGALSGMTISPILYARSGVPFTLLVPGLANGTIGDNANARPWFEGRNLGVGANYVSWDLRISKTVYKRESGARGELIFQAQNLLNRTNLAQVNNNFPANASFSLPNGGTLANGPWNVSGFAPVSVAQLSTPLAFTAAYPARQISLALKLAF